MRPVKKAASDTRSVVLLLALLSIAGRVTVASSTPGDTVSGIAARYPGDQGIEADPNVVFVERFDEPTLAVLFGRWTDILNGDALSFGADVPDGSPLVQSLRISWIGGGVSNGGHLYQQLSPPITDTLYIRYYIKYPANTRYSHTGVWIGGYNPPLPYPFAHAGERPAGNDRFSASAETNVQTGFFDHYDYWTSMHESLDGNFWGNVLLNNPDIGPAPNQWMCVEHMVKLNIVVGRQLYATSRRRTLRGLSVAKDRGPEPELHLAPG